MTRDWRRLADAVVRRRRELGMRNQQALADRSDISLDRVQAIEAVRSDKYRRSTLFALETALRWRPGSVDAVLAGGDPVPMPDPGAPEEPSDEELLAAIRRNLDELSDAVDRLSDRGQGTGRALIAAMREWTNESVSGRE